MPLCISMVIILALRVKIRLQGEYSWNGNPHFMGSLLTNTIITYFWVEKANDCKAHLHFLPNCTFVKTLQKRQSFLTTPNRCPPNKCKIKNALTNYTTDKDTREQAFNQNICKSMHQMLSSLHKEYFTSDTNPFWRTIT